MYVHFDKKNQQFIIQLIQLYKHSDVNQINYRISPNRSTLPNSSPPHVLNPNVNPTHWLKDINALVNLVLWSEIKVSIAN